MRVIRAEDILSGKITVPAVDEHVYKAVKSKWDNAAKPLDSLGKFEDVTAVIGAACGNVDIDIKKKAVIVMCADNGVVSEGISQSGQEVTLAVAKAMGRRKSSVCKMAAKAGIEVIPVDIGINSDEDIEGVLPKKVMHGTRDFAVEPAMSEQKLIEAMQVGIDVVSDAAEAGTRLVCVGEMGIGNTTTSAAVTAALTGRGAEETVGRGSGLDDTGLRRKREVISAAIEKYSLYEAGPIKVLSAVGGLDIAGMIGVMLGAALCRIPVVLDGVVSCAAALAAKKLVPEVAGYLIASHMSREPAAAVAIDELKLEPVIDAGMALGEGTGAVMMCTLLDTALTLYDEQLTFDDIEIEKYTRFT